MEREGVDYRFVRCLVGLESKVMRECYFVVGRDAWLRVSGFGIGVDEFTLSSLEVLLILATFDGLDVGLFEDVIGEDDCDDDDCDEEMSLVRIIDPTKNQKEPTYQVVLDALALTTCYPAFLITADVPEIYMQQLFREIFQICARLPNQDFDELPSDDEIVSFIKELGHKGDIKYVTKVVVDQIAQILWGMFYKKNVDFFELLWEDLTFQIENRDHKKQEKMYYPRFTKVIIHHFISKDKSISMRNRMFMHTDRDDSILVPMRFMRDSDTYNTYLAYATGMASPKMKRKLKKPASPSKQRNLITEEEKEAEPAKKVNKAPAKAERSKGIEFLSDAALLKEAQLKKTLRRNIANSDTRPSMLDRSDFESWQQRLYLYCPGKDNEENIIQSIDEGPFKMGKFRETLVEGAEGALHLGPERDRVIADLTPEEKERYKADIRATNILFQGSELTKDERESQLYDDFERFCQTKGETIHEYYVRFTKLINDMRNIKLTMPKMHLNSKFVNNMLPEWGRFVTAVKLNRGLKTSNCDQLYAYLKQHEAHANENKMMLERYTKHGRQNRGQGNNAMGAIAAGNGGFQNRVDNANPGQANPADQCDAFNSHVDEAPTAHTMFMENLLSADPIYDEGGPSYDSDILSELRWPPMISLGRLLPHVRGLGFKPRREGFPSGAKKEWGLSLKAKVQVLHTSQLDVTSAIYNGHEIVKTNHASVVVHDLEDTLEIAKKTRKKILEKMKSPLCVEKGVKISPPDYSKENYLATFIPHRHLTQNRYFGPQILQFRNQFQK
ncbi:hypothetical protein Tco_1400245 [Tanacetum coccineum]